MPAPSQIERWTTSRSVEEAVIVLLTLADGREFSFVLDPVRARGLARDLADRAGPPPSKSY